MKSLPLTVCLVDQSLAHGKSLVNGEATNNFTLLVLWLNPSLWNKNFTTSPSRVPTFHVGVKARIKSSQGLWFKHSDANIAPHDTGSPLISITNGRPCLSMEALSLASPPLDNESPSSSSSSRMPGATESGQTERVQLPKMHRAEMRSIEHPDRELIKTCRRHQTERAHTLTQTCTANYTHKINAVKRRGASLEPSWSNYSSGPEERMSLPHRKHSGFFPLSTGSSLKPFQTIKKYSSSYKYYKQCISFK